MATGEEERERTKDREIVELRGSVSKREKPARKVALNADVFTSRGHVLKKDKTSCYVNSIMLINIIS